jgi:hypothetical protein
MTEKIKIFYPSEDYQKFSNLDKLSNLISKNKNSTLVFINPEEHELRLADIKETKYPIEKFKIIEDMLIKHNVQIEYFLGCYFHRYQTDFDVKNFKLIFWKTFMMQHSEFLLDRQSVLPIKNLKKLFISLNNRSRPDRRYLIDQIYKNNLNTHGYISWHNTDLEEKDKEQFKYFSGKKIVLDNFKGDWFLPKEYFKSLLNIISESSVYNIDISEKTWYAVLSKKPFISLAARHYYKTLTSMGFELYTEIFNYDFDDYSDFKDRANSIADQLNQLLKLDLNNTYRLLLPKINHNYDNFYKLINKKNLVPDEFFKYKKYIYKNTKYVYYDSIYERFST